MFSKITIDGFRSLSGFSMDIRPGINILIGPNGSGKTNIIMFLEFIASVFSAPVGEAVNRFGGVGLIFARSSGTTFRDSIEATISGSAKYQHVDGSRNQIGYEYSFSIAFSEKLETVYFKSQTFRFQKPSHSKSRTKSRKWDFEVSQQGVESEEEIEHTLSINRIDLRKIEGHWRERIAEIHSRPQKLSFVSRLIDNFHDFDYPIIFACNRLFDEARFVVGDFTNGQALNVVPSVAKKNEDSATPPGLRRDGAGLASTLYALDRARKKKRTRRLRRRTPFPPVRYNQHATALNFSASTTAFSQIEAYLKLVNEEVQSLEVAKDHATNQLQIFVQLRSKDLSVRLPLAFLSDGTVKWLALITAIFTNRSMFAIEEPENFVHPMMQTEVLKLIRETYNNDVRARQGFVLMTTHSETLLNAAAPEEVIVVSMQDGMTRARRPKEIELIREQINESGFGLGYMYLTGVLSND